MNAISSDLRQRIVHAIQIDKNTPEQAAKRFISPVSVYCYLEQHRNQGTLQPAKRIIAPRRITADDTQRSQRQLEAHNDATLEEHCQRWTEQTGVQVSVSTMQRTLKQLSISLKKTIRPVQRDQYDSLHWLEAIGAAYRVVSRVLARGWFVGCGYNV